MRALVLRLQLVSKVLINLPDTPRAGRLILTSLVCSPEPVGTVYTGHTWTAWPHK
ncbi:hypothetical protein [Streptomyces sp. NBC_00892]|uniref:hypothetical protein n=1 Tax=Streptomyces sp. NBC_00892 TaxID=2975861 RepID=UPI00225C3FA1|nr:hypothetical protein [Streptomyces sp. NBC_00892]MCX4901621.1 hypothetical protein [Streptomyces sp. NBC_00892]